MAVLGIAYIEIAAADPALWAGCLAAAGFRPAASGPGGASGAHARGQARIRVRAEPGLTDLSGGPEADIALAVTDVPAAFEQALTAGARPVQRPAQWLEARPGTAVACVAAPAGIRHTICGPAALDPTGPLGAAPACFGLSHVTLAASDHRAAARFYTEAFGFQESGPGELRSGRAALMLTSPCGKDDQRPAAGSIRHLVFRDPASITTIPVCHISCAYAGITVTPAQPAADRTWTWA
jgi:4-hydroxyphenylpyruvate dioxygenase-like putative hemolysin